MKKILLIINLTACVTFSQWQSDVRLSYNNFISEFFDNNARNIASSGYNINVIWSEYVEGKYVMYFKHSADGGSNWSPEIRFSNSTSYNFEPSIISNGLQFQIVWSDGRNGNSEIYYIRSTDGGENWGNEIRVTNNSATSMFPSISSQGGFVHIVWVDNRDGNNEIYYKRSTDNGNNWGTDTRLTNYNGSSDNPAIIVSGTNVHVVWYDHRSYNTANIYYRRSVDNGINWEPELQLTNNGSSWEASVSSDGNDIYVAYQYMYNGIINIYLKHSFNNGINWGPEIPLTANAVSTYSPFVLAFSCNVHIAWSDNRDGPFNSEIYYKKSTDRGNTWQGDIRLTNVIGLSASPSISVSGSVLHIVWIDDRDSTKEVYYKQNPIGNYIGITKINSLIPKSFSLSQNYPNPFNPTTKIKFAVPLDSRLRGNDIVLLNVYDALGREVQTLVNESLQPGTYEVEWPAPSGDASNFSSGVYYYSLSSGNYFETKKMVLLK